MDPLILDNRILFHWSDICYQSLLPVLLSSKSKVHVQLTKYPPFVIIPTFNFVLYYCMLVRKAVVANTDFTLMAQE